MTTTTKPLRGPELLCKVVNHIIEHRDQWDQRNWHTCETVHCVGGWCQVMGGRPRSNVVTGDVRELLGLGRADTEWLCTGNRTIFDIYLFAKAFKEGFSEDGFDRAGFGRDGEKLELIPL